MFCYLCEYEHGEHDVDASLQGLDEDGFIEELKQDQWELQQDAQQPKSSQLRDLKQTQSSHGLSLARFCVCVCVASTHIVSLCVCE